MELLWRHDYISFPRCFLMLWRQMMWEESRAERRQLLSLEAAPLHPKYTDDLLHLVQRGGVVIVAQRRVGAAPQQQLHHLLVSAVGRAVEGRGSAWRPRGGAGAALQEQGAHVEVTAATAVVLGTSDGE